MNDSKGRQIHGSAAQLREKGESLESLKKDLEALVAYQEEGDELGFAEIHSEMFLTLRHLSDKTGYNGFLVTAKYLAIAGVELAKKSGNKQALAVPLFNLAKAQETLGELGEAVTSYKEALENYQNNPPQTHANRPAILADMKVHLHTCEYKNGDKSALETAETALSELEKAEEISKYNKDVWLSGAHMRIAEMLKTDNPEKARTHLEEAKKIIDGNPELVLRKSQWEKLSSQFN